MRLHIQRYLTAESTYLFPFRSLLINYVNGMIYSLQRNLIVEYVSPDSFDYIDSIHISNIILYYILHYIIHVSNIKNLNKSYRKLA